MKDYDELSSIRDVTRSLDIQKYGENQIIGIAELERIESLITESLILDDETSEFQNKFRYS